MSVADEKPDEAVVLDYELDEPPEKVWRALSTPALRQRWLPEENLAEAEPVSTVPGEAIRYRMVDDEPPFLPSIVTFEVSPGADGGTRLRIIHRLAEARLERRPQAANGNWTCLMRAA